MELRKYREIEEYPKLRILKKPGDDKEPVKGFIIMIILIVLIAAAISVFYSAGEPDKDETLQDFVERSVDGDGQIIEKFVIGKTTPKQIEKLNELVSIDVSEYKWTISSSDVRHICNKPAHGISINEFLKIYSVLNTYDYFALASKQKKDVISIEIYKYYTYKLTCIVEVRTGRKELVVITMYRNKLKQ